MWEPGTEECVKKTSRNRERMDAVSFATKEEANKTTRKVGQRNKQEQRKTKASRHSITNNTGDPRAGEESAE